MPIAAPVLAAGLSILGSGINAGLQGSQNRKSRQFAMLMYDRQRRDALADWNMQNQYDSPAAQMERLKAAGLNPNLVYGKGADNTAGPIRSSSAPAWSPDAPRFDMGSVLSSYFDTQIKQQTIDNLGAQRQVMMQDALLKAAQTTGIAANTASTQFKLDYDKRMQEISAEAARLGVEQQKANIDYTLDNNERQAAQNAMSLREAAERILNYRSSRANDKKTRDKISQEINNLKKDELLKQLDIDLKRLGIQPGDNLFMRILGRVVKKGEDPDQKILENPLTSDRLPEF